MSVHESSPPHPLLSSPFLLPPSLLPNSLILFSFTYNSLFFLLYSPVPHHLSQKNTLSLTPPSPFPSLQAEKSNPPLEEGDQLLYINSKPVSHARHEEVITMIRASRDKTPMELILIVKPKDLSRTNPIVR